MINKNNSVWHLILFALGFVAAYSMPCWAQIKEIKIVSVDPNGQSGNAVSDSAVINADGTVIGFLSAADNLLDGDANTASDIFVRDITTGVTEIVSLNTAGMQGDQNSGPNGVSGRPMSMSADGQRVVFPSEARNFDSSFTDGNNLMDIFIYDREQNTCGRLSRFSVIESNAVSYEPAISADGTVIAFTSADTALISGDTNLSTDIFLNDHFGENVRVESSNSNDVLGDGPSGEPALNSDGSLMVFSSSAKNLVSTDQNDNTDIFLRDVLGRETTRISLSRNGGDPNGDSFNPQISADGDFIVFASTATNLVANDTNEATDIFLYDVTEGKIELISKNINGGRANGDSYNPSLSDDGRFVAFLSEATNLVNNDKNKAVDVFVRDRTTAKTLRVNLNESGKESATDAIDAMLAADGQYLVFSSADDTLVAGDTNGFSDVFRVELGTIITPDTPIETPPEVTVTGNTAVLVLEEFGGVSLSKISGLGTRKLDRIGTRLSKNLNFRYQVHVTGTGDIADERRKQISKRNELTFRNLPAGNYTTRYRVQIRRGPKVIRRTSFSPSTSFTVSDS